MALISLFKGKATYSWWEVLISPSSSPPFCKACWTFIPILADQHKGSAVVPLICKDGWYFSTHEDTTTATSKEIHLSTTIYNITPEYYTNSLLNKVECQRNGDKRESKLVTRIKQDWRTNIHGRYFSGAEGRKTPPLLSSNDSWQVSTQGRSSGQKSHREEVVHPKEETQLLVWRLHCDSSQLLQCLQMYHEVFCSCF